MPLPTGAGLQNPKSGLGWDSCNIHIDTSIIHPSGGEGLHVLYFISLQEVVYVHESSAGKCLHGLVQP